jgi:hypothetical protein
MYATRCAGAKAKAGRNEAAVGNGGFEGTSLYPQGQSFRLAQVRGSITISNNYG